MRRAILGLVLVSVFPACQCGTPIAVPDGGATDGGCSFGTVENSATAADLSLFGQVTWFADGAQLPAGDYRLTSVGGCMKYSSSQDWTVHAYPTGTYATWQVVDATEAVVVRPPGTSGYSTSNGAFAEFSDCVAANRVLSPTDFHFDGGQLGIKLFDSPVTDNVAGPDGGNPAWQLLLLGACQ